jgi:hypothetical protein
MFMWLALRPVILEKSSVLLYNVKLGSTAELPYLGFQNEIRDINFHNDDEQQEVPASWITKYSLLFILSFL